MKKYASSLLLIFLLVFGEPAKAQVVTIGPMLHLNLGKEVNFSLGIEAAYWVNFWSVDGGLEYGLGKKGSKFRRRYVELQAFLGGSSGDYRTLTLNGVSAGYVFEKNKETETSAHGFQASIWGARFAGADFRIRWVAGGLTLSPGLFFKLPVLLPKISI